tara:strand:+ start:829 stop:987 length:159 start_codon:yes stop_codon:yes gene_type:complete
LGNCLAQLRTLRSLQGLDVAWLLPGYGSKHAFEPGDWDACLGRYLSSITGES